MNSYQEQIFSVARRISKSRWFSILLLLIGITYLAKFLAGIAEVYEGSEELSLLTSFKFGGFFAFSLAISYVAITLLRSRDVSSRGLFILLSLAVLWGGLADLMKIYPWNFFLGIFFVVVIFSLSRRSVWEAVRNR